MEGGKRGREEDRLLVTMLVSACSLKPTLEHWPWLPFGKLANSKDKPLWEAVSLYHGTWNRWGWPSGNWATFIRKDPGQGSGWGFMEMDILPGRSWSSWPSQHWRVPWIPSQPLQPTLKDPGSKERQVIISHSTQSRALVLTLSIMDYTVQADPTNQIGCQSFIPFTQRWGIKHFQLGSFQPFYEYAGKLPLSKALENQVSYANLTFGILEKP